MARMLDWLRSFDNGRSRIIPDSFRKDLAWWQRFMTTFNSTRRIPPTIWGPHDAHLATDACLSGLGGTSRTHFFHLQVPHKLRGLSINVLEAYTVMVALKLWASQFKGLRISIRCDNATTVFAINNLRTRCPTLQQIVREIMFTCATGQFEVRAVHIPGLQNRIPDWLSRWHLDAQYQRKFLAFNSQAGLQLSQVHPDLFHFSHNW
jgi:hypothetical protein